MMDRRTRVLAVLVAVVAGAFVLDRAFGALWLRPWNELGEKLRAAEKDRAAAAEVLRRQKTADRAYKDFRAALETGREPDVPTHFVSRMGQICGKVGVQADFSASTGAQQGDFREYVYDYKFKLAWAQVVGLLAELQNSKDPVKLIRVNLTSQYEREDRLDLDLKVSTLEYAPVAAKNGGK
jgi:hypothetical protein